MVHDKASNPGFLHGENGRNNSHLSEGLWRSEMEVAPQPRTCAQELRVSPCPQRLLVPVGTGSKCCLQWCLLTPCSQ